VNIGDGKCDDDLALNRGSCTLRAAIQEANFTRARDEIVFAVPTIVGRPVTTIRPASPLPSITHRLGLYGYTQRPCATTPAPCSRPNALATATDEQGNTLEISVPRGVVAG
jgi:CSLREA domain-containing protein